jgi:hypothetical protein
MLRNSHVRFGGSVLTTLVVLVCDPTLNPQYNIQKVAGGSSKGLILSEEHKAKISKSLKGVYRGDKSH